MESTHQPDKLSSSSSEKTVYGSAAPGFVRSKKFSTVDAVSVEDEEEIPDASEDEHWMEYYKENNKVGTDSVLSVDELTRIQR